MRQLRMGSGTSKCNLKCAKFENRFTRSQTIIGSELPPNYIRTSVLNVVHR